MCMEMSVDKFLLGLPCRELPGSLALWCKGLRLAWRPILGPIGPKDLKDQGPQNIVGIFGQSEPDCRG